ncbi:hypothetical protein [Candidatus Igneacidithiobacillus taiwanensis]|uniref:hypothetical protein n=1 Tax=Candidatus Igneacidithiobacillus taiwanensis TaxID=1945924 RepID=UPI00289D5932|nr:hypothetical protein [Candidatus Igneacidithiobacillus taiwanensis]
MKLQRYDFRATDVALGECEDGDFVRYEDCAALEAEIERLRAEIERLKAPPKVLSANEATELGFYWHRFEDEKDWHLIRILCEGDGFYNSRSDTYCGIAMLHGQFIGPLTPPEV